MKKLSLISVLLLTGCGSTGVIPMDRDSFFIGKKDGSPGLGISLSNKAEVYQEANDFCTAKGKNVFILSESITPAIPARLGSTEIQFRCVDKSLEAKPMERGSNFILEHRER